MLTTNEVHICWIPVKYMLLNMWMYTENKTIASFNYISENQSWLLFLSFLILLIEWNNLSIRVQSLAVKAEVTVCFSSMRNANIKNCRPAYLEAGYQREKQSLLRVIIWNMEVCGSQRLIWEQSWFLYLETNCVGRSTCATVEICTVYNLRGDLCL